MSLLKVFKESGETLNEFNQYEYIKEELLKANIGFKRWEKLHERPDKKDLENEAILNLYQQEIDSIKNDYGFQSVDIINVSPTFAQTEKFEPMRSKFLDEHTHTDHEVRYFIDGQGLFYIHHEDKIYGLLCTAGDFISVPANKKHWFDMGSSPNFKCIRFFTDDEGWVPVYEKGSIANQFPLFDEFVRTPV